jgi:hypothetical protein
LLRGRRSHHEALQIASRCASQARRANTEKRTTRARRPCFQRAEASMRDARASGRSIRATSSKTSHSAALNAATDYVPKPVAVSIRPPARDQNMCLHARLVSARSRKSAAGRRYARQMRRRSLLATCPPFRRNDERDARNGAEALWRPSHTVALSVHAGRRARRPRSYSMCRSRPLATNECPPNATAAHLSASPRLPRAQRTQSAAREAARPPGQRTGRGQVQRLVGRLDCQHAASTCAPQATHLGNRSLAWPVRSTARVELSARDAALLFGHAGHLRNRGGPTWSWNDRATGVRAASRDNLLRDNVTLPFSVRRRSRRHRCAAGEHAPEF